MRHLTTRPAVEFLTAAQFEALLAEIALFSPGVCERGQRYAAAGRVESLTFDGSTAEAKVRGTVVYDTDWDWLDGEWYLGCSCPVEPDCKHA